MLVVLLIGITQRAGNTPPTIAAGASSDRSQVKKSQFEDLLRRTEILREELRRAHRRMDLYESELAQIRERVATLNGFKPQANDDNHEGR